MEKRNCKLCFKRFANGRALGGHMKSHKEILQTPPKIEQTPLHQLRNETDSSYSDENEEENGLYYGLRENPKKSFRLVDPVFSSSTMDVSPVIIDYDSETESFKNPIRRRSKRNQIPFVLKHQNQNEEEEQEELNNKKKKKLKKSLMKPIIKVESPIESEPVSSISDFIPEEEDIAICLMMLSRDTWVKEEVSEKSVDDENDQDSEEITKFSKSSRTRKKYECESCKKTFRSYQALGGHRANHKKINGCIPSSSSPIKADQTLIGSNAGDQMNLKCPICFRTFKSRQALGGHKRIHNYDLANSSTTPTSNSINYKDNLIDLNLPAPIEDDNISQMEISVLPNTQLF